MDTSAPTLWRLINRPQQVDPRGMRFACTVFLISYSVIAAVRYDPSHTGFLWLRLAVCAYAAAGVWMAPRATWSFVRAYTVGLALFLPLQAAYIDGMLGNHLSEVALSALATFAPLVFVRTARDFIVVDVGLLIGNTVLLRILPSSEVTVSTLAVVLGGAMATGTVAGLTTLIYRARWNQTVEQLQQALSAKSEFLNTMSHELRSPLHVIVGYSDMLGESAGGLSPSYLGERIRAGALELLRLVEDTMNVARLDAGKITVRINEFAVEDLVPELADSLRALPEAKAGVSVRWEVRPGLPRVRLDRLKVKEIVQNLASNALKFTSEGTVCVTIDREADRLRIEVQDTGIGIPQDHQARIFEVFERIEPTDGPRSVGAGLGLYIVKSLVHLMHGTIEVTSHAGAGSCFSVRLPLWLDGVMAAGAGTAVERRRA